ncbi:MAG TPA: PIN domain-containing protein [Candidatus Deferrimicrobium sp.]|nr:PIN domain-containing protein [Candidatus Deferrimicrobium sp.]
MKPLKIYLDTSVYSALFDKRNKDRQELTKEFWNNIEKYELYVSAINFEEIDGIINEEIKIQLKDLLNKAKILEVNEEVKRLAEIYIKEGIVPEKYGSDAIHIALTTVYSLDILISWNFKHLVKRKTRIEVNLINSREGYKPIEIIAPPEL